MDIALVAVLCAGGDGASGCEAGRQNDVHARVGGQGLIGLDLKARNAVCNVGSVVDDNALVGAAADLRRAADRDGGVAADYRNRAAAGAVGNAAAAVDAL